MYTKHTYGTTDPRVLGRADVATSDEQLCLWPGEETGTGREAAYRAGRNERRPASPEGWPLSTARSPWVRRTLAITAAIGLGVAVMPRQVRAAIPVIDVGAITQLVTTIARLSTQISIMTNQYNAFVNNTRKLTSPYAWRNINATVAAVDGVVSSGTALSYSTTGLVGQLGATFPGYSWNPATIAADMQRQKQRTLGTVMQGLIAAQSTWSQINQSVTRLNTIKGQVAGLTSAQQAAEVGATIGVMGAEELALLRQQLLASSSAQSVVAAEQLNHRLQALAAVAAFEAPAAAIAASPPVRPRMNVAAYAF